MIAWSIASSVKQAIAAQTMAMPYSAQGRFQNTAVPVLFASLEFRSRSFYSCLACSQGRP